MAWRRKRRKGATSSLPSGIPSYSKISRLLKEIIRGTQYDFFEAEAFEVKEVILNEPLNRGSVTGTFINNPNQEILGDIVLPLTPNITQIPLIGEHVVVVEYNGQHYYTSIINRKNSPNENSIPGVAGNYVENTKFGETFERKGVNHIQVNEGDIVFEGRFGHSIKFGSERVKQNNKTEQKPQIKIVAGHRDTTENIDKDDSSIYLLGGLGIAENDDKKIQIKSNSIFINGKNINLNSDNIKLGNDAEQPVVKGDELVKLLDRIVQAISTGANAFTTETGAGKTIQGLLDLLPDTKNILSKKVKTS